MGFFSPPAPCVCVGVEGMRLRLRPASSADENGGAAGWDEAAVVPLLRHQGEMDSCGKDASGNTRSPKTSLKTSGNLFEVYMMRGEAIISH